MLTLSRLTALAAVVGIASLGTEGTLAAEAQVLKVVERATADAVTDTGAEGDSAGDLLTFANGVFDEANATQIGTDNGWCIRTAVGQAWECAWTMTLADGQINVSGPFLDNKDSLLTVTGGTGSYAGVSGEMLLHARNPEGTEYDFVYKLMR